MSKKTCGGEIVIEDGKGDGTLTKFARERCQNIMETIPLSEEKGRIFHELHDYSPLVRMYALNVLRHVFLSLKIAFALKA